MLHVVNMQTAQLTSVLQVSSDHRTGCVKLWHHGNIMKALQPRSNMACKAGSSGDILGAVSALCGIPLRAAGPCPFAALMQVTQGVHCRFDVQPAVASQVRSLLRGFILRLDIADVTE